MADDLKNAIAGNGPPGGVMPITGSVDGYDIGYVGMPHIRPRPGLQLHASSNSTKQSAITFSEQAYAEFERLRINLYRFACGLAAKTTICFSDQGFENGDH